MTDHDPVFSTERFDVFYHQVVRRPETGLPRDVFEAWHHSQDIPRSVCEITLWGSFVEWCHVCECHRRQGIATEVLRGLEDYLKRDLEIFGATPAGKAFCARYLGDDDGNE